MLFVRWDKWCVNERPGVSPSIARTRHLTAPNMNKVIRFLSEVLNGTIESCHDSNSSGKRSFLIKIWTNGRNIAGGHHNDINDGNQENRHCRCRSVMFGLPIALRQQYTGGRNCFVIYHPDASDEWQVHRSADANCARTRPIASGCWLPSFRGPMDASFK